MSGFDNEALVPYALSRRDNNGTKTNDRSLTGEYDNSKDTWEDGKNRRVPGRSSYAD